MRQHRYLILSLLWMLASMPASAVVVDVTDQYLANAGFDNSSSWQTSNVAAGGSTNSLVVEGWQVANSAAWSSSAAFGYGGGGQINGVDVPASGADGSTTGGALGISTGWGGVCKYTQTITLPAGKYRVSYAAYNNLSDVFQSYNYIGFESTAGNTYGTIHNFLYQTWMTDTLYLNLTEETTGNISVGLGAVNGGSGANAKVFIDYIKIEAYNAAESTMPGSTVSAASWAGYTGTYQNTYPEYFKWSYYTGDVMTNTTTVANGTYDVDVTFQSHMAHITQSVTDGTLNSYIKAEGKTLPVGVVNNTGFAGYEPTTYHFENVSVTDGSLDIRVGNSAEGANWLTVGVPTITRMTTPYVSYGAFTLPVGNTTAGFWYACDIPITGKYRLTSSASTTLTYTQTATDLITAGTSLSLDANVTSSVLSLTKGKLYLRTSSAATVGIDVAAYSYEIGEATTDITYIQGGETITVDYSSLNTNDPDATVTVNPVGVTFDGRGVTCTATATGFTFLAPVTKAGQSYTLSIPAGIIAYTGHTGNTAQTITMKAPLVFDGTYYLQNEDNMYLSRGSYWGTHAIADAWGQAIDIATAGDGFSTIRFLDSEGYLYNANSNIWCDGTDPTNTNTKWTFSLHDGKYRLSSALQSGMYVKMDDGDENLWSDGSDEKLIQNWTLEAPAIHISKMEALRTSMTVLSNEVSGLSTKTYVYASTSATAEEYQGSTCVGANTSILSKTIYVLPGIYKFSIPAFHRIAYNDVSYPRHGAGTECPPVYAFFGDAKVQLHSVYDATTASSSSCYTPDSKNYYPNTQGSALTAFLDGSYVNTIWVRITDSATITYGIQNQGRPGTSGRWTCYATDGIEITRYYDPIRDGEDEDTEDTVDGITLKTNSYFARGSENIFGRFSISGTSATPTEQGLCYSAYRQKPTTADSTSTYYLDYCGKIFKIFDLKASTPYYVRPYAVINGKTYYGVSHKVYTIAKGTITYGIRSSDNSTYDTNITNAVSLLVGYWNCYTNISGYYVNAGYVSGVATADCSYGGYIRFGSNTSYQQCGTAMHESLHGIGVGTGSQWSTLCSGKNWTGPRVNEFIRFFENSESAVIYGDGQHAWCSNGNGGLSYTINGAHEDAYSDLQRTGNSLLAQAFGEDGLKPTNNAYYFVPYYSVEQEETDLFYIRNSRNGKYLVDANGTLTMQSFASLREAQKVGAGWRLKFNPSTQWYTISSIRYGNKLSHENYVWGINKYDSNIAIIESVNTGRYWLNTPTRDGRNLLGDLSCGTTAIVDTGDANGQDWIITRVHRLKGDVDRNGIVEASDIKAVENILLDKGSTTYDLDAADMNGSGTITISDLNTLVDILDEP